MSVALLGGGLAAVPTVAAAQNAQCEANEPRRGNGQGEVTFDKQTYKPGDVVTLTGTGFAPRPSDGGFLAVKLNSNKSDWPENQSAGDGLKYNDGAATTLEIPGATIGDGNFTVRVVLPEFSSKFQAGKHVITLLGGNDGGDSASRSASIWVNETGDDYDPCGATPGERPQPQPQPNPEPQPSENPQPQPQPDPQPSEPGKTTENPAPKPSESEKPSEPAKPSESTKPSEPAKPSEEPQNNFNKGIDNLLKYFEDGTNVRKVVVAVASVLGIAGLATAVLGSLVNLNLIPREWFPPQYRF